MKRLLCGLATVLPAAGALAADSGSYIKVDVGANYMGEITQDFQNIPLTRDLDMSLGVRASVAEGLHLNRFMAVEVETGMLWNELDESEDWLMQIPIFANFVLRYECKGGFAAYVGVGGGGAVVIANSTVVVDDSDVTIVPAWQGMAGLSYNFGPNASIGLVYKYMGMTDPELELSGFGVTEEFKLEDVRNHYAGIQFTYSF